MKIRAIIVEDEAVSRDILRAYLSKYCPNVTLVGEASNINEAYELIQNNELELVFLDVEMPFGNAFDLLEKVEDRRFETVFVTAYDHYAIEALNKEKENELQNKVLSPKVSKASGKITIPQQDGFEVLDVNDIVFCKADDNYTEIHLANSKKLVSKTLKHFEEALLQYDFVRIHKSYLVNINSVVKYKKGKGGSVVVSNGKEILVSSAKKATLLSYFK